MSSPQETPRRRHLTLRLLSTGIITTAGSAIDSIETSSKGRAMIGNQPQRLDDEKHLRAPNTGAEHVNGPLHKVVIGDSGPPVVFLHPNPLDWSCWLYQMTHLSTWFQTIGIDLPGYGRSPTAEPGLTMRDVTDACWEAVDDVSSSAIIAVGCSVGSWVATDMAHSRPDQVAAVVLSGVAYSPSKDFAQERITGYETHGIGYRRGHALEVVSETFGQSERGKYLLELFHERDPDTDAATIVEMFRALGVPDPDSFWTDLRPPCLIITGSLDGAHEGALELGDHIPGVEIVTIEGAGHTCALEQPWAFDAAMLDFLERNDLFNRTGA